MPEDQTTEWKAAWHDDHLKVLCGFANAHGGRLLLGYDDSDRKFFIKTIRFGGLHRYETPPYPCEALREAFLHALVHRSYGSGIHIQCRVYDTRLTLWNEGKLPDDLPDEALLRPHASKPRNPLLAAACFKAGYIDAWGRGIEKMTHPCKSAGLPTPTFESNSGGVLATLTLHPATVEPVDSKKHTPEVTGQFEAPVGAESGQSRGQSRWPPVFWPHSTKQHDRSPGWLVYWDTPQSLVSSIFASISFWISV